LKFSHPLYLSNGEQLGKNKDTTIKVVENTKVGHLKIPK
jgi:hypothetical protein